MAAEKIGRCKCPLCGSENARLSLSKKQLPVVTCNGCQVQLFTRSDRSDSLARALLIAEPEPTPAAPPVPAPAIAAPPPPPAAPRAFSWGVLGLSQ